MGTSKGFFFILIFSEYLNETKSHIYCFKNLLIFIRFKKKNWIKPPPPTCLSETEPNVIFHRTLRKEDIQEKIKFASKYWSLINKFVFFIKREY